MYDFIEAYKTGGYKYVRKGQKIANIFELNYDSEAENVEADQEDL